MIHYFLPVFIIFTFRTRGRRWEAIGFGSCHKKLFLLDITLGRCQRFLSRRAEYIKNWTVHQWACSSSSSSCKECASWAKDAVCSTRLVSQRGLKFSRPSPCKNCGPWSFHVLCLIKPPSVHSIMPMFVISFGASLAPDPRQPSNANEKQPSTRRQGRFLGAGVRSASTQENQFSLILIFPRLVRFELQKNPKFLQIV